jgi:hypothetical protein
LLLRTSTERVTLAVLAWPRSAKRKTPKGGTKGAFDPGRTRRLGRVRENLPPRRRCRKGHRWPVNEKQPESEEARPVAQGKRAAKNRCRPCAQWWRREENYRRVFTWFAGRWRNHQSKRAEKPHSKSRGGNVRDGPATRPKTPFAMENSVGKPAALARGCAQCRHGEESVANSHRPLSGPSVARLAGPFVF